MSHLNLTGSFILYFCGSVLYFGRAIGKLGPGNFLLIHKNDGSALIHSGLSITARNYIGAGSTLEVLDGKIIFSRKKERIEVYLDRIIYHKLLSGWSEHKVILRNTEAELVDKIFHNWDEYIDGNFAYLYKEYRTDVGDIDLLGITFDGVHHVIEAKRRKVTIADCGQLRRYVEVFEERYNVEGYLASPTIGEKAMAYLEKHGYRWIQVDFD